MNEKELLKKAIAASISAGAEIMDVYNQDFDVDFKADNSPLTLADRRAHETICRSLHETGFPVLSEEGKDIPYETRKNWEKYWLVDPLDGTKEFVKRNGEFTVNIALVAGGKPEMGVIYVPVSRLLYFASPSAGAFKTSVPFENIQIDLILADASPLPLKSSPEKLTVAGSRSHMSPETSDFIDNLRNTASEIEFISIGSSLKMCLVAEGKAHIYPRFGPTMEWDTAAGQAIVEKSGGTVMKTDGKDPVCYNKPELLNPWFIASRPY